MNLKNIMKTTTLMVACAALAACATTAQPTKTCAPKHVVAKVDGMTCEMCAATIAAGLKKDPAVKSVKIDVPGKTVTVTAKKGHHLDDSQIAATIKKAGFTPVSFDDQCK